ncbi:hypothetical protein ASC90_20480 [Rhizobium sp. Root1220]|nr:hypothetical protein ASC90_20480 [Rhizobium sp. Root1220]
MQGNIVAHALKFIDAGDALGEVLFGLIMALTFTVGARLVTGDEGLDARDLVLATLGCNVTARLLPRRFGFDASDEQLVVNKAV